jgi:hypothetical protein
MLTSRTLTSAPNSRAPKPRSCVPVPAASRAVVSLTFPPLASLEGLYEGAFTIFCASESPSKRDVVSR